MSPRARNLCGAIAAFAALAPLHALAQADNSNAITSTEHANVTRPSPDAVRALPRASREDVRRRELSARHADGLTAAELGMLYGATFASGADAGPPPSP